MNQQTITRNTCPKCKKGGLDTRIPRPALMKLFLSWLPLRRYICYQCNRKSYKWRQSGQ